jgi:hypothetical protein
LQAGGAFKWTAPSKEEGSAIMQPAKPIKNSTIAKKLRIPFIVLVLLLPGLFVSGQVKFITEASSPEIGKQEFLQVKFVVQNAKDIEGFIPPDFHGFHIMQEPSQSSETSIVNGNVSESVSLTYDLQPEKTGKFVIDGATATVDGKKMRSNPVSVTVTSNPSANSNNNNNSPFNSFPASPFPDPSPMAPRGIEQDYILRPGEDVKEKMNRNMFVKLQVDRNNCYVGEPIVATYKLYSRLRSESRVTRSPSLNGFSVYDMVDPNTVPSSVEKLNGKSFLVHILRKAQLVPLQSGTIDLDPIEVDNTVHFVKGANKPAHRRSGDAMQDLFDQLSEENNLGPEVEENITLDSKPLSITVKPLPEENKPADFSGAVGNFSIVSALVSRNVNAQDEADLKVTVRGSGNLPVITAPQVRWPSGMEAFNPRVKEEINKTTAPLSGSKTFDYIFTTRAPGHYTIPPVSLSYFDPAAHVYKQIQSNPVDFEVMAAAKNTGVPTAGIVSAPAGSGGTLKELIDRHLESLFAILILSCLAFYLWRQNLRLRKTEQEKARRKEMAAGSLADKSTRGTGTGGAGTEAAEEMAGRAERSVPGSVLAADPLSDAKIRFEKGDYPGFYRELNRTVWKAVADKLDLPASELNKYNVVRRLEAKGWDASTALSLEHLLNECEMNLYTPAYDTYNMQQLLSQAETLLGILISNTSY